MIARQFTLWGLATFVGLVGCESAPPVPALPELTRAGRVVLGSPHLTGGIPGKGPLKRAEVEAWLADPKNHEPLEFVLPLSLRLGGNDVQLPADQALTRAKIELGRQLYFDSRLAGPSNMSCSHCHHPTAGYSRWMVMPVINRNVSAGFNRILSREQFWDGRVDSLEDQIEHPLTNKYEMHNTVPDAVRQIEAVEGYRLQFERIYGGVTFTAITQAISCFERALVTGPSPFDFEEVVRRSDEHSAETLGELEQSELEEARRGMNEFPLSENARRGRDLFFSDRTHCATCHSGPNFTDEQYHAVGLPPISSKAAADTGRFAVTGREEDRDAYKTPTLRNIAQTPPYMHAGQLETLEEVVAWFNQPKAATPHVSPLLRPLGLSSGDQRDLVEFLRSLTGPLPPVESGRLPE